MKAILCHHVATVAQGVSLFRVCHFVICHRATRCH